MSQRQHTNRRIVLNSRPHGATMSENFLLETADNNDRLHSLNNNFYKGNNQC